MSIRWVPLEADPEMFSQWSKKLGLDVEALTYHDVLGLDEMLLDMVPKPAAAVLLLYPITKENEELKDKEDQGMENSEGKDDEGMLWIKQTIGNACGTQGLIHALANSPAKSHISPDSPLSNLISQAKSLTPLQRSELLATSKELEEAHSVSAQGGQSIVPDAESRVNLHFTAFVRHPENGSLIELDGRRKGVKVRDVKVEKQKDLLKDTAAFVQKQYMSLNPEEHNFSLIALAPPETD